MFQPYRKTDLKFHQSFHSETGEPIGAVNTLTSLVPPGLFLKILGVNIIDSTKIEITHPNPFPWPVTVKYRGLTVSQQLKKASVVFRDGQSVVVETDHPQIISLSDTG